MWVVISFGIALVLLLCFALAIATFSFDNFVEKKKALEQYRNSYGISTLEYVSAINKHLFGESLKITRCEEYQDHYSHGVVALSNKTMQSNSLASFATVSHELGHAKQDYSGDTLNRHWRLRKIGRICGLFFMPLLLVGAVLSALWVFGIFEEIYFLVIGLSCVSLSLVIFAFAIILKYKEIKIEREASDFAIEFLKEILTEQEVKLCQEFLNSARLTYWAGLIRTLLSWTMLTQKNTLFG